MSEGMIYEKNLNDMPENAAYPNPWIGHSQWRTLISLEGEVISGLGGAARRVGESAIEASWPAGQADRVFHIYPLPGLEAGVFFLAGHSFLINTPGGIFQALNAPGRTLPSSIILLSWEDRYIDGLMEYCYAYAHSGQGKKLEIYTSEWGWDTIKNRVWSIFGHVVYTFFESINHSIIQSFLHSFIHSPPYSTVTDLARFRGWSTSQPRMVAMW